MIIPYSGNSPARFTRALADSGHWQDGTSHAGQWPLLAPLLPTQPTGPVVDPPLQPSSRRGTRP